MSAINIEEIVELVGQSVMNGSSHIGFAHLADKTLPRAQHCVIPGLDPSTPGSTWIDPGDSSPEEVSKRYAECIAWNAPILAAINPSVPESFRSLCLAFRASIATFGLVHWTGAAWRECVPAPADQSIDAPLSAHSELCRAAAVVPAAIGLMGGIIATLNWWNTNHHTVGDLMPSAQLKILCTIAGCTLPDRTSSIAREMTSMFRVAIHPVSTPMVLTRLLHIHCDSATPQPTGAVGLPTTELDAWLDVRRPVLPSGCKKLVLFSSALAILADDGIAPFHPASALSGEVVAAIKDIRAGPSSYHIGCHFLNGQARESKYDALCSRCEAHLPDLAHYLGEMERGTSLLASPAMRLAVRKGATGPWKSVVLSWKANTGTALDSRHLMEAASCMASTNLAAGVEPDSEDPAEFVDHCRGIATELRSALH